MNRQTPDPGPRNPDPGPRTPDPGPRNPELGPRIPDRAWAAALLGVCLFLLGGIGVWLQEYAVWIPRLLTDVLVLAGLALSVAAAVLQGRGLLRRAAPAPAGRVLRTLLVAGVPPVLFVAWYVWMTLNWPGGL
jgi:hypothetical protein